MARLPSETRLYARWENVPPSLLAARPAPARHPHLVVLAMHVLAEGRRLAFGRRLRPRV